MQPARWVLDSKPSFIREILKVTSQPHIISFAGGLPAPELFPASEIATAFAAALGRDGARALQYSVSEGDPDLRAALAARLTARGTPCDADDILLTNGSQHGLDLVAKALLDPGDVVLVEDPTYLGALQAFRPYQPRFVPVGSDGEGMLPAALAEALSREPVKLVYTLPTFQNPRGTTMSLRRRHEIVDLCSAAGVALIEDDPYGELRYRGESLPGLRQFWDQAIYLGTFSKTMAPALRLGWVVAPPVLMPALKLGLQATCLNVGALTQQAATSVLSSPTFEAHLRHLRGEYGERMRCMLAELPKTFPAGTTWSEPDGGLFIWVTLGGGLRAVDLVQAALDEGVAFVPGEPFYAAGGGESSLRLNFSNSTPVQIHEGMARLTRAVHAIVSA